MALPISVSVRILGPSKEAFRHEREACGAWPWPGSGGARSARSSVSGSHSLSEGNQRRQTFRLGKGELVGVKRDEPIGLGMKRCGDMPEIQRAAGHRPRAALGHRFGEPKRCFSPTQSRQDLGPSGDGFGRDAIQPRFEIGGGFASLRCGSRNQLDPALAAARDDHRFTRVRQLAKPVKSLACFPVGHRFHLENIVCRHLKSSLETGKRQLEFLHRPPPARRG